MDTCLTAYNTRTYRQLAQATESKDTALLAVHVATRQVVVATRRKQLFVYGWAAGSGAACLVPSKQAPLALSDVPVCMACLGSGAVVVGYKKQGYVVVDAAGGGHMLLLETDRPGVCVHVTSQHTPSQPHRILLSAGNRGVVLEPSLVAASGWAAVPGGAPLTWSAPPAAACVAHPFLVTASAGALQVHELSPALGQVQTLTLDAGGQAGLCLGAGDGLGRGGVWGRFVLVGGGVANGLALLHALPLHALTASLVRAERFQEALNLCALCPGQLAAAGGKEEGAAAGGGEGGGVNLAAIHAAFAGSLFGKGDLEGAVTHWLEASAPPPNVLAHFPDLIPDKLPLPSSATRAARVTTTTTSGGGGGGGGLGSGAMTERAAAAVVRFLESVRPATSAAADTAERRSGSGAGGGGGGGGRGSVGGRRPLGAGTAAAVDGAGEAAAGEEALLVAGMVDSVLVAARLACRPPRKWDVVDFLSKPNRVHEPSCGVLLAARGVSYAEPLLCLYRSRGLHERVLGLVGSEAKCVGEGVAGAWDKKQWRQWRADYLQSLWRSTDPRLVRLVVSPWPQSAQGGGAEGGGAPVVSLLRDAPLIGLGVFLPDDPETTTTVAPPAAAASEVGQAGGLGFTVKQVVELLKRVSEPEEATGAAGGWPRSADGEDGGVGGASMIPISAKRGLAIRYLEMLMKRGACPAEGHDELGKLLIQGANDPGESPAVAALCSGRLERFLLDSALYDPHAMMAALPPQGHSLEKALVLSRLGEHDAVLRVYVREVCDPARALEYCRRIYARHTHMRRGGAHKGEESSSGCLAEEERLSGAARDVYLALIKVYLEPAGGQRGDTEAVANLLNRHFTRLDPVKVLAALPPATPLKVVSSYLGKAMRHLESRKRTLSVKHGLLKVHFMKLSHEMTQRRIEQLSDMAQVPALAKLGTPRHSFPPVLLSEHADGFGYVGMESEHEVSCVRHVFEVGGGGGGGHSTVLQFEVRNNSAVKGAHMNNVVVRVVPSDEDLYAVHAEIQLPFLPFASTGSCYVLLREKKQTMGAVNTSFTCDLYYDDHAIPLQNLEVSNEREGEG